MSVCGSYGTDTHIAWLANHQLTIFLASVTYVREDAAVALEPPGYGGITAFIGINYHSPLACSAAATFFAC